MKCSALADLDYFVPNESEAETITGIAVRNVEDAKKCAENLLAGGIRRVIITLGANGSLLAGHGISEHVPPFAVNSIDSSGAGDAFIGSFAVFLAEGVPEQEAVRRANLYAGLSTTGVGTQKSFYDRARFDAEWAISTALPGERAKALDLSGAVQKGKTTCIAKRFYYRKVLT